MIGYLTQNHALIHAFQQPRSAASVRRAPANVSNRVFKIKFMAFEAVCLGSFFYVLYLVVKHEFGW